MIDEPRWRESGDYQRLKGAPPASLAWEFLRRNDEYKKDVSAYILEVEQWAEMHPDLVAATPGGLSADPIFTHCFAFEHHCPVRDSWWAQEFRSRWHFHHAYRPQYLDGGELFMIDAYDDLEKFKPVALVGGDVVGPHVLIPVDLSEPLQTLQERVMWTVRRLRRAGIKAGTIKPRKARARRTQGYIEQLRVFDAVAAGATWNEIGEALAPAAVNTPTLREREKRFQAKLKAAKGMVAAGYKVFLTNT